MSFLSNVVRNITYPLWMIKDGNAGSLKYLNHFKYLNNLSQEELFLSQLDGLKKILNHAYNNCDYYKNVFNDHNFNPNENFSIDNFKKLPLLTKIIVKENYNSINATNIPDKDKFEASTGGSTGTPMRFARDRECLYKRKAQDLYLDEFIDYRIGDKLAYFVSFSHYENVRHRLKAEFRNSTCERMLKFNPYNITDDYMREYADKFKKFEPDIIKCFPNSLAIFAKFVVDNKIELPSVKAISCTGENLYPEQRALFERAFNSKVFERYGSKECGIDASECNEHAGMHVFTEGVYIELLGEDNKQVLPGEIGRIVITDLFNKAFPLIRYEIGDLAIYSDNNEICSCGNNLPKIQKVIGRDRDILFDSQDNPKPGYLFVEVINNLNIDAQFQIVQKENKDITIKIGNKKLSKGLIEKLTKEFSEILGDALKINIVNVSEISRDPSGKYRYVKSDIKL